VGAPLKRLFFATAHPGKDRRCTSAVAPQLAFAAIVRHWMKPLFAAHHSGPTQLTRF
jgi:hypothetical protein